MQTPRRRLRSRRTWNAVSFATQLRAARMKPSAAADDVNQRQIHRGTRPAATCSFVYSSASLCSRRMRRSVAGTEADESATAVLMVPLPKASEPCSKKRTSGARSATRRAPKLPSWKRRVNFIPPTRYQSKATRVRTLSPSSARSRASILVDPRRNP